MGISLNVPKINEVKPKAQFGRSGKAFYPLLCEVAEILRKIFPEFQRS